MTVFEDGALRVDFANQEVTVDGRSVALTSTEYRLLVTPIRDQGQVLPPHQQVAWHNPSEVQPSRVKYAVQRLRGKLGWNDEEPPNAGNPLLRWSPKVPVSCAHSRRTG